MSIFNELLPKINEISNAFTKNFNDDLKDIFECFDKFEEEYQNGRGKAREKALKEKNVTAPLQSINEDEDEPIKPDTEAIPKRRSSNKSTNDATINTISSRSSTESNERASKKRSKNEVDGISSPEQDKRQKRNASVKAQSIISKQVNVNLTQKLRRENSTDKTRGRRRKDDDKENEPAPVVQIKLEKLSIPPEPMDLESLPLNIEVKQEGDKDGIAMPPPVAPIPKPRKNIPKEKSEEGAEEDGSSKRRTTRTKKQTDTMPPPAPPSARATRASSRAPRVTDTDDLPPPEQRPKRTRAKKKVSEVAAVDTEKEIPQVTQENGIASPMEKPRPKRTRRAQKAAEKQPEPVSPQETTPPKDPELKLKEERISQQENESQSPILPQKGKVKKPTEEQTVDLEDTYKLDTTVTISNNMDKTVVLPNGLYNHAPVTPKNIQAMNETVVLEKTMVIEKAKNTIMDATVVIDKDPRPVDVTDDNSLLTDDSDCHQPATPPKQNIPAQQPASAVKEKVQQFEELASRVTRTKTRAMAKKDDQTENQTPPDKISKPILSVETLNKMNSMIFNGKAPQISSSASKPRVIVPPMKSQIPASTSKLSSLSKHKEAAEETLRREKDDARRKKEALLEAKRELQKRKREEKMAAAAAAREAAEKERTAAAIAAAKGRQEKQAHADQGRLEKLKEADRKKQELARKVAETEERRKAEEQARQVRLAEEQRRADAARRKQLEEAEAMKKEAVIMAKEIEKRKKEYMEKQKLKQRLEEKMHTPLRSGTAGYEMEPVYMSDGFQYLNSDEEEEPEDRPVPDWSTSKARRQQLSYQCLVRGSLVDRLFSVRAHTPDLRAIFPLIERARLKRTSSAVWRTPPQRLHAVHEDS